MNAWYLMMKLPPSQGLVSMSCPVIILLVIYGHKLMSMPHRGDPNDRALIFISMLPDHQIVS